MTFEIGLVLGLLAVVIVLFAIEKPRADIVAALIPGALVITGLLEPLPALSGFANPAVITVVAVFILSAGLSKTGVANVMGNQMLRLAGDGEIRLMVMIMILAGVLSAFMNNVGCTALLLPVVMDLARRTGTAPSRLLIPLSFSSLLGGTMTLIGTPPNILVAQAVQERGLGTLGLFSFTPVGSAVLAAGILFMVLVGRRLLPDRDLTSESGGKGDLRSMFGLHKRLLILAVPQDSPLVGKSLADCRISSALGLTVIGITRDGRTRLAPQPSDELAAGDRLLAEGRPKRLAELRQSPNLLLGEGQVTLESVVSAEVDIGAVRVAPGSSTIGQTLLSLDFRNRFGEVVLAIRRGGLLRHRDFDETPLEEGDILLLQARPGAVLELSSKPEFESVPSDEVGVGELESHMMGLRIPADSMLVGMRLGESRLAEAFGLVVLALDRESGLIEIPGPDEVFEAGDALLVKGDPEDLDTIRGLQSLEVIRRADQSVEALESSRVGLTVAALSPTARLANRTLRQLHFREKYGLSVLAIWRRGRVKRSNLANVQLEFGDALLLHGPRDRLRLLATESDFLVLSEEVQEPPRYPKAPHAVILMAGVIVVALTGWLPIYIVAPIGAALMVVFRCLEAEEIYREVEWRAVVLIGGMLPLGLAMQQSGAGRFVAERVVAVVGGFGPTGLLLGMFLLAVAGAQAMPTPATALLLAPIAIDTAIQLDVSPLSLVMAVALGASSSFINPITHPANVLVMGPGGYRFVDYVKVGVPLVVVTMLVVLVVLPVVWPL